MKYEWRKEEKNIYLPGKQPVLVEIPKCKYLCIKGKGDPNKENFSERVGVLFSLAYAIRMMPKNGFTPEGYFEYTVYPLEGLWGKSEEGRRKDILDKEDLVYTIMIKQPDFVNQEIFEKALEITNKKKPHMLLKEVYLEEIQDGLSVQMMHHGSYDDEPKSFSKMKEFINENELEITSLMHREIYILDVKKAKNKSDLKTVLRYLVHHK